jgi:hypothetical protein
VGERGQQAIEGAPDGRPVTGQRPARKATPGRRQAAPLSKPLLAADQSAECRDRLLSELDRLKTPEDAANWAYRVLPSKNALVAEDASLVEAKFQARIAAFESAPLKEESAFTSSEIQAQLSPASVQATTRPRMIGPLAKELRRRDKEHRKFVSSQPCLVCGRSPADAHHLRFAQPRALSMKVSDEFTVPVCRVHHRELHRIGDERVWWRNLNIDPLPIALNLWRRGGAARATHRTEVTEAKPDPTATKRLNDGRAQ